MRCLWFGYLGHRKKWAISTQSPLLSYPTSTCPLTGVNSKKYRCQGGGSHNYTILGSTAQLVVVNVLDSTPTNLSLPFT